MRWIVGLLLVIAAAMKAVEVIVGPAPVLTKPPGSWFPPIQIGSELGIGLLVLSGLYERRVRWLTLAMFAAFAAYSFSQALGGAASCACFGLLRVPPWWVFSLDLVIVVGIAGSIWRIPCGLKYASPATTSLAARRSALVIGIACLSALCTAILVRSVGSRSALVDSRLSMAGDFVLLEPEKWIGQELPIAAFIDVDLSRSTWTVLLHRQDCPDCQAAVPRYEALASHERVALIEVPPYGDAQVGAADCAARHGHLSADREWFVRTPVEIRLQDGVVVAVESGHDE